MISLALINGTAGGILLVLPIIGLEAGWLMIPLIIFISSLTCYYTAVIMFRHLGQDGSVNKMIQNHFHNHNYSYFYNIIMLLSFIGQILLYFQLLVSETQGLFYYASNNIKQIIPYEIAILLIILVLVCRYFQFQDNLLFYGILSIAAFSIFILWIIIERKKGYHIFYPFKKKFIDLAATMSQGFSIHNMMIPIILRSKNPKNYKNILAKVFVISALLYIFLAYGSFALLNRKPLTGTSGQTVEDYFQANQWEITIVRIIYIINIVTVLPQFLSLSRLRLFNLFEQQQQIQTQITIKQVVYYFSIISLCLITKILKLRAEMIIELNGSMICFLQIYLIPLALHLKCIWFDYQQSNKFVQNQNTNKSSKKVEEFKKIEIYQEKQMKFQYYDFKLFEEEDFQNSLGIQKCLCHQKIQQPQNYHKRNLEIIISLLVLLWGIFVMLYTIVTQFYKTK